MGLIRLLLAVAVVCAHSSRVFGVPPVPANTAVECFFVISGFYMAMVLERKYLRLPRRQWRTFISARLMRLLPMYLVVLALSVVLVLAGGSLYLQGQAQRVDEIAALPPITAFLLAAANVLLVGQDVVMFSVLDPEGMLRLSTFRSYQPDPAYLYLFVPQAWTVGLEICFYLIAPFLLRLRSRHLAVIAVVLLAVRVAAAFHGLGMSPWSYRFFPFELPLFLAGVLAYRARGVLATAAGVRRWLPLAGALLTLSLLAYLPLDTPGYSWVLMAFPLLFALAVPGTFEATKRSRWDRWIGELSYPVYIVHVLVISVVASLGIPASGAVLVALTLAAAIGLTYAMDRPLEAYRQRRVQRALADAGVTEAGAEPVLAAPAAPAVLPASAVLPAAALLPAAMVLPVAAVAAIAARDGAEPPTGHRGEPGSAAAEPDGRQLVGSA